MMIIFARHGETEWNQQKKVQGWKNTKLTKNGLKQSKSVAKILKDERIDAIYSSDLDRAYLTAKEISKYHNGVRIKKKRWLREISYGKAEGLTRLEVDHKYPHFWAERVKDKYNFKFSGAENYTDLEKRALPELEKLIHKHRNETILLVGHANINRVMIAHLLNMNQKEMDYLRIPHDCVYFIDLDNFSIVEHQLPDEPRKSGYLQVDYLEEWRV